MKESITTMTLRGTIKKTLKYKDSVYEWVGDKYKLCQQINHVVNDLFHDQGFTLTLRQLYYQLVKNDWIPNHDNVYKKVGEVVKQLRMSGHIDWAAFEDRSRVPYHPYFEHSVKGSLERTIASYALDRQKGQPYLIEVWTEKDAISGILRGVCEKYGIKLVVNKGYSSISSMYEAYKRFVKELENKRRVKIIYFGDHDPSGLDMLRDINDRIKKFLLEGSRMDESTLWDISLDNQYYDEVYADYELWEKYSMPHPEDEGMDDPQMVFNAPKYVIDQYFTITHAGLTMEQIERLKPPPNFAKMTDTRSKPYVAKYGDKSWEVDALDPSTMIEIVEEKILEFLDEGIYNDQLEEEKKNIKELKALIKGLEL